MLNNFSELFLSCPVLVIKCKFNILCPLSKRTIYVRDDCFFLYWKMMANLCKELKRAEFADYTDITGLNNTEMPSITN